MECQRIYKRKWLSFLFLDNLQSAELKYGSVIIAGITSCTNTSNPGVMLGAGLVAKKAFWTRPWGVMHLNTLLKIVFCELIHSTFLLLNSFPFIFVWQPTAHQVKPWIKTSLAPGSGAVTKYLLKRYIIWINRYKIQWWQTLDCTKWVLDWGN